jgi:hypothetical protein
MLLQSPTESLIDDAADVDHTLGVVKQVHPPLLAEIHGLRSGLLLPEDARFRVPAHFGPVPKHAERIDQARHFGGLRRCQFVLGDHRRIVLDAAEGINTSTYPDERARQAIYAVEPIP